MISIVCRSVTRGCFSLSSYRWRVKRLLKVLGIDQCELSILLVDDDEIRALNSTYRQKDASTDVLSFPQLSSVCMASLRDSPAVLGDIVLSLPTVARQAQNGCLPRLRAALGDRGDRWSNLDEATFLTVHGLLHLLGYDHMDESEADEMENVEAYIVSAMLCRNVTLGSLQSLFG